MPRRSRRVQQHLLKSRDAAIAAVDNYNRPGTSFRTRTFVLLMTVAWTSCFHAVFYDKKIKPWYVKSGTGKGTRYDRVDGDPKHWELSKCVKEYWGSQHPPSRKNIEFFLGLRNRIEHRYYPELDPASSTASARRCYMNFEDMLVKEFGTRHGSTGPSRSCPTVSCTKASSAGRVTTTPSKCGLGRR